VPLFSIPGMEQPEKNRVAFRLHLPQIFSFLDIHNDIFKCRRVCKRWRDLASKRWKERKIVFTFCFHEKTKLHGIEADISARQYHLFPPLPCRIHGKLYTIGRVLCTSSYGLLILTNTQTGLFCLRLGHKKHMKWLIPSNPAMLVDKSTRSLIQSESKVKIPGIRYTLSLSSSSYSVAAFKKRVFIIGGSKYWNECNKIPSAIIWEYSYERNTIWQYASLNAARLDPSAHVLRDKNEKPFLVVLGGYLESTHSSALVKQVEAVSLDVNSRILNLPDIPVRAADILTCEYRNKIILSSKLECGQGYSLHSLDLCNMTWNLVATIGFPDKYFGVSSSLPLVLNGTICLIRNLHYIYMASPSNARNSEESDCSGNEARREVIRKDHFHEVEWKPWHPDMQASRFQFSLSPTFIDVV